MRNPFNETTKFLKKAVKDQLFIQSAGDTVYISNGHFIAAMPGSCYAAFIEPVVPGLPMWTGENFKITINNGKKAENGVDLETIVKKRDFTGYTKPEKIILDLITKKARAFFWEDHGKTSGAPIDEIYYQMSKEYSDGSFEYVNKFGPLYTSNNDLSFLVLPLARVDAFDDLLETINGGKLARTA